MVQAKYSRYYTYVKPVIENKIIKSVAPYIFSILTITILIIFAVRPTISTILNLQKDIENNKKILSGLGKKEQDLTQGKKNLENIDSNLKIKLANKIPAKADVASIIKSLKNVSGNQASSSALQIQPLIIYDSKVSGEGIKTSFGEVSFTYNIQGTYREILQILEKLSRADRLIKIDNLVISKGEGPAILSLSGKALFLK